MSYIGCLATTSSTLGVSASLFHRTHRGFSTACASRFFDRALEDRALVSERVAILWAFTADLASECIPVAAEWLAIVLGNQYALGEDALNTPGHVCCAITGR